MAGFVGRQREMAELARLLAAVRGGGRNGRPGQALLIRGRRRVGKSRLVEEFIEQADVPSVFFTAVGGSAAHDLIEFAAELGRSELPDGLAAAETRPQSWDAAFALLAGALPADRPSIVVLDEMPYLVAEDPTFEGALQKAFDRRLSRLPVLLVLIGSDVAMMTKLNTYGRPFYQRGTELVVPPLSPHDVAAVTGLGAADAFDAYLVTGGLPLILEEWPTATPLLEFLGTALDRPTSPLLVSGERTLAAEFPVEAQARRVLSAIGHGERAFSLIGRAAGDLAPGSLRRALSTLVDKGVVAAELPLSTRPSRETRYRVADPYLRFWLSFLGPGMPLIERGRGDRVLARVRASWTSWRGRAIEPVLREALWRLADDQLPTGSSVVGGYWTRTNDPEIDIVAADRAPIAQRITTVGSIKWLERKKFDVRDLARLAHQRDLLPGADDDTELLAVARAGGSVHGVRTLGPEELLAAWA